MTAPEQWGPPTWSFLHTLAEKIKEEHYPAIYIQLFNFILNICHNLPCPTCSQHAKQTLSQINVNNLKTKSDLKNMLYTFHNSVNKRKNLPLFKYEDLTIYKSKNLIVSFNNFINHYNTKGNMNLINDSFHRTRLIQNLRKWLMENINRFDM